MARFLMQLPTEIIKDIEFINGNSDKIFGEMTKAGAKTALVNIKSNIPKSFVDSDIMNCLGLTKVYKTPTDGGINTKVGFFGYFTNHLGKKTPAPLVVNVFEYGKSNFQKQPFFRKSFNKAQIERAMIETQRNYSKELLKDE